MSFAANGARCMSGFLGEIRQNFGGVLAQFVDSEGAQCSVGAEAAQ